MQMVFSVRFRGVLATSLEFSPRPYLAYATTLIRLGHVGEDRAALLTRSVGAYHVHAVYGRFSLRLCHVQGIEYTRFNVSDNHFCFNNDTVNTSPCQNSELLLTFCLLQIMVAGRYLLMM